MSEPAPAREPAPAGQAAGREASTELHPAQQLPQLRVVGEATERMHAKAKRPAEELRAREQRAREAELEARRAEQRALALAKRAAEQARQAQERATEAEREAAAAEQRQADAIAAARTDLKERARQALTGFAREGRERLASAEQARRA